MEQIREKKGNKEQQRAELVLAAYTVISRRRVLKEEEEESSGRALQRFVGERVWDPHVAQAPLQPKPPPFK